MVVLTNVGLEHTRWLGPTIPDIAREKLAVVRPGATLVLGERQPEVEPLAAETGATIVRPEPIESDLPGYQHHNFEVAATAARAIRPVSERAVRAAAAHANVPGRLQIVGHDPLTLYDGAHNPSGVAALAEALPDGVVAVMSILDDKDAAAMLRALLPKCAGAVFTASRTRVRCRRPRSPRWPPSSTGRRRRPSATRAAPWSARANSPAHAARWWPRARSTWWPTCSARPAPAG